MNIKIKIYSMLVNRVPGIQYRYLNKRNRVSGIFKRMRCVVYLLWLNFLFHILRIRSIGGNPAANPDDNKKLLFDVSESEALNRTSPKILADELMKFLVCTDSQNIMADCLR